MYFRGRLCFKVGAQTTQKSWMKECLDMVRLSSIYGRFSHWTLAAAWSIGIEEIFWRSGKVEMCTLQGNLSRNNSGNFLQRQSLAFLPSFSRLGVDISQNCLCYPFFQLVYRFVNTHLPPPPQKRDRSFTTHKWISSPQSRESRKFPRTQPSTYHRP